MFFVLFSYLCFLFFFTVEALILVQQVVLLMFHRSTFYALTSKVENAYYELDRRRFASFQNFMLTVGNFENNFKHINRFVVISPVRRKFIGIFRRVGENICFVFFPRGLHVHLFHEIVEYLKCHAGCNEQSTFTASIKMCCFVIP